jgi:ribonuclease R
MMPTDQKKFKIVGVINEFHGRLQVDPCDKKQRNVHYEISPANMNGARLGDVVVVDKASQSDVKVTRVLGNRNTPGILGLISICEKGMSETFNQATLNEAKGMTVPDLTGREDLRKIPLVTIDGADTRDIDDAVFAEKTADGGFHLIVAIADVSWYVKPGSALDKEAYERGNSTYLPDRVVPMLPEALSNGLCSLNPHVDRACMAFHIWIDKDGNLTKQKVVRGLMNSAARLTYDQVQAAKDGKPDATTAPLMNNVITPLYDAYAALRKAREARGAMDLDQPEYKVSVGTDGKASVGSHARIDSQRVIEEFMIIANVAAATALEDKNAPCVYRVHDKPPYMNKAANDLGFDSGLGEYLNSFGLKLPKGDVTTTATFQGLIEQAAKMPNGHLIIKAIIRAQAKASYSTHNIGHFGLALERYAHFTSPIRRYSDLLVHRSLAAAFNMGAGGLTSAEKAVLEEKAQHISETEKLSAQAERSAGDRFSAAYLSGKIGKEFTGRVTGVTPAGLFIRLDSSGSDGLLPLRFLPQDYYDLDNKEHTLIGREHGRVYRIGAAITVRLKEANSLTGSVTLVPANDNSADLPGFKKIPAARPQDPGHGPR